jgi:serine/arginine repetitive matrix protein 2
MGASFDRERATWRSTAERSLQSSKLTRSLGRSRSQSAGRTRAQLKDIGGVGFLATKTLLGNQLSAPTVGTPTSSEGTQTQQTRSGTSHARTTSSGGHSRAGSKGKIAVMRAATGLCISGEKTTSSQDLPRGDVVVISRYDNVAKGTADSTEVQHLVPNSATTSSPSPVAMDSATVGIALCSPLPSTEEVAATVQPVRPTTYARDHSYTSSVPRRSHHIRSNSDYAGPHPSAVAVTASASALASEMSARHRLPPQAALHPYATSSALPSAAAPTQPALPTSLPPPRLRPNPRSRQRQPLEVEQRVVPHAYAAADRFSSGPLVFADALSYGLQRRLSADSGLGESEGHHHHHHQQQQQQQQQQYEARSSSAQLLTPMPDVTLATTPDHLRGSTFLSLHSRHTMASSPVFLAASPSSAEMRRSAQTGSSAEPGSRASSPLQSPRPFGTIEDLDRYRNLFYDPKSGTTPSTTAPSDEHHHHHRHRRGFSHDTASSLAGSISGGSGLAVLTRQLNNEFGGATDWWLRGGHSTDHPKSDMYSNRSDDPDATLLPLRMHQHQSASEGGGSFTARVPQDVESHISSVLERSDDEMIDGACGFSGFQPFFVLNLNNKNRAVVALADC